MTSPFGKLIKKTDSKLLAAVEVQPYPWLHFNEDSLLFPDNPRKTVVMSSFHDEDELERKVKVPEDFKRSLGPKIVPLFPMDLTEDYRVNQEEMRLQHRKRLMDEEELVSFELQELATKKQIQQNSSSWRKSDKREDDASEGEGPMGEQQTAEPDPGAKTVAAATSKPAASQQEFVATQPASQAQSQFVAMGTPQPQQQTQAQIQVPQAQASATQAPLESQTPTSGIQEPEPAPAINTQKVYEEAYQKGLSEGQSEGQAQGHEAGVKKGFEDGFSEGEQKGIAAVESRTQKYFAVLAETLKEFDHLRSEILAAGQDVFIEISKLCSEKLLRMQLQASDESLKKLYLSGLDSYMDGQPVTIELHPDDAKRLRQALSDPAYAQLKVKLRENASLTPGDFKLEGPHEVTSVNLTKAIDSILESMRNELFSATGNDPKKVG